MSSHGIPTLEVTRQTNSVLETEQPTQERIVQLEKSLKQVTEAHGTAVEWVNKYHGERAKSAKEADELDIEVSRVTNELHDLQDEHQELQGRHEELQDKLRLTQDELIQVKKISRDRADELGLCRARGDILQISISHRPSKSCGIMASRSSGEVRFRNFCPRDGDRRRAPCRSTDSLVRDDPHLEGIITNLEKDKSKLTDQLGDARAVTSDANIRVEELVLEVKELRSRIQWMNDESKKVEEELTAEPIPSPMQTGRNETAVPSWSPVQQSTVVDNSEVDERLLQRAVAAELRAIDAEARASNAKTRVSAAETRASVMDELASVLRKELTELKEENSRRADWTDNKKGDLLKKVVTDCQRHLRDQDKKYNTEIVRLRQLMTVHLEQENADQMEANGDYEAPERVRHLLKLVESFTKMVLQHGQVSLDSRRTNTYPLLRALGRESEIGLPPTQRDESKPESKQLQDLRNLVEWPGYDGESHNDVVEDGTCLDQNGPETRPVVHHEDSSTFAGPGRRAEDVLGDRRAALLKKILGDRAELSTGLRFGDTRPATRLNTDIVFSRYEGNLDNPLMRPTKQRYAVSSDRPRFAAGERQSMRPESRGTDLLDYDNDQVTPELTLKDHASAPKFGEYEAAVTNRWSSVGPKVRNLRESGYGSTGLELTEEEMASALERGEVESRETPERFLKSGLSLPESIPWKLNATQKDWKETRPLSADEWQLRADAIKPIPGRMDKKSGAIIEEPKTNLAGLYAKTNPGDRVRRNP